VVRPLLSAVRVAAATVAALAVGSVVPSSRSPPLAPACPPAAAAAPALQVGKGLQRLSGRAPSIRRLLVLPRGVVVDRGRRSCRW
jgi:hypothetical protein